MGKGRWMIVAGIAVIVVFSIVYGFLPKPVSVDIAKVHRGPMRVTIEEEGRTRVVDRYVVSAPVAGFMRRVGLDVGDPVRNGQTVVELEPQRAAVLDPRTRAAAEAAVSSSEAALRAARENARAKGADADYAKTNLERSKKLYEAGYIAKDALDQSESEAKRRGADLLSAEASARAAQYELDKARTALRYSAAEKSQHRGGIVAIRSPVDGRVLKIHRESEGVVNFGDPLIDIGDPSKLEVKVEVLSADAVRIKPGTPVIFERWGGDADLSGKVRVVEPAGFTKISSLGVEEQRTLVIADFNAMPESLQKLGDGFRVDALFIIWEGKDILQVPASALFRSGDGWAVFVVIKGRAGVRRVEVGHRTGLTAEVVSGLKEGDEVIAHPDDAIKEGTRIRAR